MQGRSEERTETGGDGAVGSEFTCRVQALDAYQSSFPSLILKELGQANLREFLLASQESWGPGLTYGIFNRISSLVFIDKIKLY